VGEKMMSAEEFQQGKNSSQEKQQPRVINI
jgi:hypothetical protein